MEKLNLKKEETYKIEVNDNGEYIEFDLTDIALPDKIFQASEKIELIDKKYKNGINEIDNKNISKIEKAREVIKLEKEKCQELRKEFDSFLGENACQKIFGNKNRYEMFSELLEALDPHFKKMKINLKKAREKLIKKYIPKNEDVM